MKFPFTLLFSTCQNIISDVTRRNQKEAESLLRTQFKMELFGVHTEESTFSKMFGKQQREKEKSPMTQLKSYYQVRKSTKFLVTRLGCCFCMSRLNVVLILLKKKKKYVILLTNS